MGSLDSEANLKTLRQALLENRLTLHKLERLIISASSKKRAIQKNHSYSDFELHRNKIDQHNRNWSVRIHGLSVPEDLVTTIGLKHACMITAYDTIIKPVLIKLTPKPKCFGDEIVWGPEKLANVPECFNLLANGHFVGRQQHNLSRTIIIRFFSRYLKNLFLRNSRKYMPNPFFSVYPDLTYKNHHYLMAMKQDPRVKTAWSYEGHLKFTLNGHPDTFFVHDIRKSTSALIENALNTKSSTKLVGSSSNAGSKSCTATKDSISSKRRYSCFAKFGGSGGSQRRYSAPVSSSDVALPNDKNITIIVSEVQPSQKSQPSVTCYFFVNSEVINAVFKIV